MNTLTKSTLAISAALILTSAFAVEPQGDASSGSGGQQSVLPQAVAVSCTVNLVNNTHNCSNISAITFVYGPPAGGRTVMKVTLSPDVAPVYRSAKFNICYNAAPMNYTVNIGDSSTNNGYGGDAATQSNDAEMQIVGQKLTVFGNDQILTGPRDMLTISNFVTGPVCKALKVSDQQLDIGANTILKSYVLYALAGQPDSEGPVNYDIYAAFNRVISPQNTDRVGTGVSKVTVTLFP